MLKLLAEINLAESKAVKIKTPYIVVPMNLLNVKGEYILIKCIVYPIKNCIFVE
jgi:hypothetical protein